jgi:hypothetical protein
MLTGYSIFVYKYRTKCARMPPQRTKTVFYRPKHNNIISQAGLLPHNYSYRFYLAPLLRLRCGSKGVRKGEGGTEREIIGSLKEVKGRYEL